jgi:hypothetical protein
MRSYRYRVVGCLDTLDKNNRPATSWRLETRQRTYDQLSHFHGGVKRFVNPHRYPVGLEKDLFDLRTDLILRTRGETSK